MYLEWSLSDKLEVVERIINSLLYLDAYTCTCISVILTFGAMQLTKICWPNIISNLTDYISDECKATLISDSIGKYVGQIDGLTIKSYRAHY